MKRPMVFIAAAVVSAAALCALRAPLWSIFAAETLFTLFEVLFFRKIAAPLMALALAVFTALSFSAAENRAEKMAAMHSGETLELTGTVSRAPEISDGRETIELKTKEFGLIELTRYGNRADTPAAGDEIRLIARLGAPSLPKNDYAFDNRAYLFSKRIYMTAVDEGEIEVLKSGGFSPAMLASRLRSLAVRACEKRLGGDALALCCAVVFGDKGHMSDELKENLSIAGLSHVAAVSGMHLSLVTVILLFLAFSVFGRGRAALLAAMAGAVAFTLLTGAAESTVRACIMTLVCLAAKLVYREADSLSSLGAAVTAMVLFNPMVIYGTGFQLSALATLGILLFMPLWLPRLSGLPSVFRAPLELMLVSAAAQICTLPVLLSSFNSFPTYFLLANLAVVPLLSLALPLGLLLPLLGGIPLIGALLNRLCSLLFGCMAFAADKISSLPGAELPVGTPSAAMIAACAAAAAALYLFFSRRRTFAAVFAALTIVLCLFGRHELALNNQLTTLSFLNVGRGDCAVFCLPGGKTVLIDAGADGRDAADFLEAKGRFRVDAAVVTSPKREHIGGFSHLMERGRLAAIFVPEEIAGDDAVRELVLEAGSLGVEVEIIKGGGGIYLEPLRLSFSSQSGAVALLADCGSHSIFFCSDGYVPWESCEIVKTPNHGAGKYNYAAEIGRTKPRFAVISATASVRESCKYLAPLEESGANVCITGERGTVNFLLSGGVEVKTTR